MSIALKMEAEDINILDGISVVIDQYDHFIIDVWGVLHDGIAPYPGTISCLKKLKDAGKKICLVSNTPRRGADLAEQLKDMQITPELYDYVLTAGESANLAIANRIDDFHTGLGQDCYFIGEDYMRSVLTGLDSLNMTEDLTEASFIVNALGGTQASDHAAIYDLLDKALKHDLPMVCANPDIIVNIGGDQFACAGMFAKYYEDKGGRVVYHGKPHRPIYEMAYALLGKPDKNKMIAIGDSLHTDIQGANDFGIDSVFNLVGIHWEDVQLDNQPGTADPGKIRMMLDGQAHKPTAVLCGLYW